MNKKYKISVIVPFYNSEKYIEKTVKSIIGQEFDGFEVILIDDGSIDKSKNIVSTILKNSSVPYTIISEKNSGLSAARNRGLSESSGEFVCFIDSDDILDKKHLQSLYSLINSNHLDVVHSDYEVTTENVREGSSCTYGHEKVYERDQVIAYAVKRKPAIIVCGFLIRKSYIEGKSLYFNERLKFGEDSDYIYKTIFQTNKIGFTHTASYKYLNHSNSIMKTISLEQAQIYLEEFTNTILYLEGKERKDIQKLQKVYYREILGFLHAYSKCANRKDYDAIIQKLDLGKMYHVLKKFPEVKTRIAMSILWLNPNLFYYCMHGKHN